MTERLAEERQAREAQTQSLEERTWGKHSFFGLSLQEDKESSQRNANIEECIYNIHTATINILLENSCIVFAVDRTQSSGHCLSSWLPIPANLYKKCRIMWISWKVSYRSGDGTLMFVERLMLHQHGWDPFDELLRCGPSEVQGFFRPSNLQSWHFNIQVDIPTAIWNTCLLNSLLGLSSW